MMYIAYKKINGYTISDNTDHQRFLYKRVVSAPTILVFVAARSARQSWAFFLYLKKNLSIFGLDSSKKPHVAHMGGSP